MGMKNQRSTQTHKWLGLRAIAAVLMLLMALTCCFAASAADATALDIDADDLLYPNYNGVYAAVYGDGADVTTDFKVSSAWKQAVAPDAKFAIEVKSATLASTQLGETTVAVTFTLTGDDAASYTVGTVTVPAMVYDANPIPQINISDLTFKTALQNGIFVKEYDGKNVLTVGDDIILDTSALALPAGVDIAIESAKLNAAGVAEAKALTISFKLVDKDTTDAVDATEGYLNPPSIVIPAKVTPKTINWVSASLTETVDLVYGKTTYDVDFKAKLPAFADGAILAGDTVNVASATNTFTALFAVSREASKRFPNSYSEGKRLPTGYFP